MSDVKSPHRPAVRRASWLLLWAFLPCLFTGCDQFMLLAYLVGGPPSISPDFYEQTKKDMKDYGVTVAVVCTAPKDLKWSYDEIDYTVAEAVSYQLNDKGIKVIFPDQVRAWLDKNPDWTTPREIGDAFGVKYVIHIDMRNYALYEKGQNTLLRGRSEYEVSVWEMNDDGTGSRIYSKENTTTYPLRIHRSSQDTTLERFKREYLHRLSYEIGRLFFEYYTSDDIGDAA